MVVVLDNLVLVMVLGCLFCGGLMVVCFKCLRFGLGDLTAWLGLLDLACLF